MINKIYYKDKSNNEHHYYLISDIEDIYNLKFSENVRFIIKDFLYDINVIECKGILTELGYRELIPDIMNKPSYSPNKSMVYLNGLGKNFVFLEDEEHLWTKVGGIKKSYKHVFYVIPFMLFKDYNIEMGYEDKLIIK